MVQFPLVDEIENNQKISHGKIIFEIQETKL